MFGAFFYMARDLDTKKIGAEVFGELWNVVLEEMEKIKWSKKVTIELLNKFLIV